jgi:hypothetical protein
MATITQTFTTVGTNNWTVPNNVSIVSLFIVGGGGSGAGGRSAGGGGDGGNGGQVQQYSNVTVTPGSTVSVVVGAGGAAVGVDATGNGGGTSSFISGTYSAAGGNGGAVRVGTSGRGGSGATGNGAIGANPTGGDGGPGAQFRGGSYGVGGGGGCGPYDRNSTFPVRGGESPGPGAPSAGDGALDSGPAYAGDANTGRGGGGGRSFGETTERSAFPPVNNNPTPLWLTRAASSGAAGGSGVVIVTYEESLYTLSLIRDNANSSQIGFIESGTVTLQLRTLNVANGTLVPYTIGGLGITAADFSPATLSGSFTVSSTDDGKTGTATVTLALSSDVTLENTETATLTLNSGLASLNFNIGDFSKPPLTGVDGIIIRVVDYNNLRTKVNNLLGDGTGATGYGQTVRSQLVDENTRVRVLQWDNLRYDIFNIWKHQFGVLPTIADVRNPLDNEGNNAGAIIKASSTTAPYDQYDNFANILIANRFGIHSSQAITRNGPDLSTPWIKTYTSAWTTKLSCTVTVTWATVNAARYFFNSGGEIRFNSSRTGGATTPQNSSWSTLLTGAATLAFGGQLPNPGFSPLNGQNYYRLSSTPSVWATRSASSPYGSNEYTIKASTSDTAGSVRTVTFLVEWTDGHISIAGSPDTVDGTIALAVTTLEASGNFEPAGTGSFTVTGPTITLTDITVS